MTRGQKLLLAFSIAAGAALKWWSRDRSPLDGLSPLSEEWLAAHAYETGQEGDVP